LVIFAYRVLRQTGKERETADTTSKEEIGEYENPLDVEFGGPLYFDNGRWHFLYVYGTGGGAKGCVLPPYFLERFGKLEIWSAKYIMEYRKFLEPKAFWAPKYIKLIGKYYLFL